MRIFWERLRKGEQGVTLVELLVTISILTVVLTFVLGTFVSVQNAATGASLRLQNLDEARVLMDVVSKDVRTATRLSSSSSPFDIVSAPAGYSGNAPSVGPTATDVWFYANITLPTTPSPCPDIVHLFVDNSVSPPVLKEQNVPAVAGGTPPNCTYTGSYTTRLVGKYVANPANMPVFTYYQNDANGNPVAMATSLNPLSAANRLLVNAIGVTLAIRQSTNYSVPYTTLVNRVRLANVDYNPPSPSP
jgi:prepilin-type N-terminal cleavage/methylation domain-containing protein